ncbi:MAG: hypothetical protein ACR2HB_01765 [Dehalococcoidia bacterium]
MTQIATLQALKTGEHREADHVLTRLLAVHGVGLAMASTILRFRNPRVFPIIDKRAYYALFGAKLPVYHSTHPAVKIATYFTYIDEAIQKSEQFEVPFEKMDRVLYLADKARGAKVKH